MAGVERIELPSAVLETDVLPLYDTPITKQGKNQKKKSKMIGDTDDTG